MKLITVGSRTPKQHTKPCSDCPWRRDAINGWLGGMPIEDWLKNAHGENRIDCHVHLPHQCVGAATYRANICKRPRDTTLLSAKPDRQRCFANPQEFKEHHEQAPTGEP